MAYKNTIWAPVLRKQKAIDPNQLNEYWDEYYRGVSEGYLNDDQISKIEAILKVNPIPSTSNRNNFNKFFINDIQRLVPLEFIIINLRDLLTNKFKDYIFVYPDQIEILLSNLCWINSVYFRWQYRRFPEPIDNYLWLVNNRNFLLRLLHRNLSKVITEPAIEVMLTTITYDINDLVDHLYKIGEIHGFIEKGHNYDED